MREAEGLPGRRYSHGAMLFHWLIAALIVFNLYLGLRMDWLKGLDRFTVFQLHKSIGITVLALSVLRIGWRLTHRPPPFPSSVQPWERISATVTHWAFYVLMLILPLTGWVIVSASPLNIPTLLYKTIPLPHIGVAHDQSLPVRAALERNVGTSHTLLAYLFGALIVLHIAAALKHHFWQHDEVLGRMLPGLARRRSGSARQDEATPLV